MRFVLVMVRESHGASLSMMGRVEGKLSMLWLNEDAGSTCQFTTVDLYVWAG